MPQCENTPKTEAAPSAVGAFERAHSLRLQRKIRERISVAMLASHSELTTAVDHYQLPQVMREHELDAAVRRINHLPANKNIRPPAPESILEATVREMCGKSLEAHFPYTPGRRSDQTPAVTKHHGPASRPYEDSDELQMDLARYVRDHL